MNFFCNDYVVRVTGVGDNNGFLSGGFCGEMKCAFFARASNKKDQGNE